MQFMRRGAAGAVDRVAIHTLEASEVLLLDDGTLAAPGLGFRTDPNTGLYLQAADALGIVAGGKEMLRLAETGVAATDQLIIGPAGVIGSVATPSLAFGDGDSGFYEVADDDLVLTLAATNQWIWDAGLRTYASVLTSGARLEGNSATATNPVHVFNGDDDTGIGRAAADQLSLIAGGVEGMRISEAAGISQVEIAQGTNDAPFFDFQATADADATSAISTLTTSGAVTHHIQFEINGTTFWIAGSTTDPS